MTDRLFKILIIGDSTVGKTSWVQRYLNGSYRSDYKVTIGVDFAMKTLRVSSSETIRLQLWDIAGQERVSSMTRVYYKDASACIIMFDISAKKTFNNVLNWKKDLDAKVSLRDGSFIPCLLIANKVDLLNSVTDKEIDELANEHSFVGWAKTSVKDNFNVSEPMRFLAKEIMSRHRVAEVESSSDNSSIIRPEASDDLPRSSRNHCC